MRTQALLMAGVISFGVLTGCSETAAEKTIINSEATLMEYDTNQLVADSTVILEGEVVSSELQDDYRGMPVTDYKIKVAQVYKGTPGSEVEVRTQGGENERIIYVPDEDMVTFHLGEKVTLFLTDEKGNRTDRNDFEYFVVGQYQGKMVKKEGKIKNGKFSFNSLAFQRELERIEKENIKLNRKQNKAQTTSDI